MPLAEVGAHVSRESRHTLFKRKLNTDRPSQEVPQSCIAGSELVAPAVPDGMPLKFDKLLMP